jgi:ribosomal protein L5
MVEVGMMGMGEALVHSNNELSHNTVQNIEMVNGVNELSKLKRRRVELWDVRNHWQIVEKV